MPARETLLLALVNIGFNPTFGSERLTIEAHLVDFESDLVGADLYLFFLKRLRDEVRFPNVDALVEQLQKDRVAGLEYYHSQEAQHYRDIAQSLIHDPKPLDL